EGAQLAPVALPVSTAGRSVAAARGEQHRRSDEGGEAAQRASARSGQVHEGSFVAEGRRRGCSQGVATRPRRSTATNSKAERTATSTTATNTRSTRNESAERRIIFPRPWSAAPPPRYSAITAPPTA